MRWSLGVAGAALVAVGWLVQETRELAEQAGREELRARDAERVAAAANAALAAVQAEREALRAEVARLGAELLAEQDRNRAVIELVQERQQQEAAAAAAAAAVRAASLQPMPEGVRLCLQALHETLRDEGFTLLRVVGARELDADGLRGVELVETAADGLGATIFMAGLLTASLDRATGRLELRAFDGLRVTDGERTELPSDGWPIVLAPVDGSTVERRLPFLVKATGSYPVAAERDPARAGQVDPLTRDSWLERLDRLCDLAGGDGKVRVQRFRGMQDGWFLDAQLVGTDARHHVVWFANCRRVAVEVDAVAGTVSLRLVDGILRQNGVDSKIGAEGHRMLLSQIEPSRARDTMLGMVVEK